MDKAEERACEHTAYCRNQSYKDFLKGYKQAEKDLALTWEDASVIVTIAMDIIGEGEIHGEQNIYTEVLKRFNEQRTK